MRCTGKAAAVVFYTLVVGILGLVTVCVVSGARPTSSYSSQTSDYGRQQLVSGAHAVFDSSASEDRGKPPLDVQQQDLDKLTYLPLAFKGFCGFYLPTSQRFGFDAVRNRAELYEVSLLHAGWYQNFGFRADPPALEGLEFAQTIRLCQPGSPPGRTCTSDYVPSQEAIEDYAAAHPGALWLIGNEPDAPAQDCITPPRYAQLYHELYGIIKGADPSARVAIGGVVQGTPLRLRYLDMILQEYQTRYGEMIPVDVWNVHGFILQEHRYVLWGCYIPCGITDVDTGILYEVDDHDNMTFFKQQIVAFRQWMNDHGERDKQLIVTEYGILMPVSYGFDEHRVQAFMLATFDYFLTASNPSYGYPADCGKLVQRWAWYSLDDAHFEEPYYNTASHLFDPDSDTKQITALGTAYGNYVSSLP